MAAGLLTLAQFGWGLYESHEQKKKADEYGQTGRPKQKITEGTKDYLAKSKFNAFQPGLAGQAQMEAELDRMGAENRRSIKESGLSPFAMMSGFGQTQDIINQQKSRLNIAGLQAQERAQGQYYNALNTLSAEERQLFDWNQKEPYLDDMAASSAYENAYLRNRNSTVNTLFGNISNLALMNEMNNPDSFSGGAGGGIPSAVEPSYRAPQSSGGYTVPGATASVPNTLEHRETPVRYTNSTMDLTAAKAEMESLYGPMTNEEFLQYYRLMQGLPAR